MRIIATRTGKPGGCGLCERRSYLCIARAKRISSHSQSEAGTAIRRVAPQRINNHAAVPASLVRAHAIRRGRSGDVETVCLSKLVAVAAGLLAVSKGAFLLTALVTKFLNVSITRNTLHWNAGTVPRA